MCLRNSTAASKLSLLLKDRNTNWVQLVASSKVRRASLIISRVLAALCLMAGSRLHYISLIELIGAEEVLTYALGGKIKAAPQLTQPPCSEKVKLGPFELPRTWSCLIGLRGKEDGCPTVRQQTLDGRR